MSVRTAERSKTAQITLAKIQEDLANVRTRIPEFETEYLELRARIPSEKQVIEGTDGDRRLGLVSFLAEGSLQRGAPQDQTPR